MTLRKDQPDGAVRWWLRRSWVAVAFLVTSLALADLVFGAVTGARAEPWDVAILALLTLAIALGSARPLQAGHARAITPLATAASVALVFASSRPGKAPVTYSATTAIVCAGIGYTAGICLRRNFDRAPRRSVAIAVPTMTAAVMALLYRSLPLWGGRTSLQMYVAWDSERWKAVSVMATIALVAMTGELVLVGFLVTPVSTVRAFAVDVVRSLGPIYWAALSTGIAAAIALQPLSLWAIPLVALPLILARNALRRTQRVQRERRQTIAALSTMTDVAGFTRVGHSARVAKLAQRVGGRMGLSGQDLMILEDAALLHDIGQVSLSSPIPGGATVEAAPLDQLSIAQEGGLILRRSGVLDEVATIVEAQTVQYRQVREFGEEVPLAARIIKVCNAFDDMTCGEDARVDAALERLSLGLGYEYDPAVVTVLQRIHGMPRTKRKLVR